MELYTHPHDISTILIILGGYIEKFLIKVKTGGDKNADINYQQRNENN